MHTWCSVYVQMYMYLCSIRVVCCTLKRIDVLFYMVFSAVCEIWSVVTQMMRWFSVTYTLSQVQTLLFLLDNMPLL